MSFGKLKASLSRQRNEIDDDNFDDLGQGPKMTIELKRTTSKSNFNDANSIELQDEHIGSSRLPTSNLKSTENFEKPKLTNALDKTGTGTGSSTGTTTGTTTSNGDVKVVGNTEQEKKGFEPRNKNGYSTIYERDRSLNRSKNENRRGQAYETKMKFQILEIEIRILKMNKISKQEKLDKLTKKVQELEKRNAKPQADETKMKLLTLQREVRAIRLIIKAKEIAEGQILNKLIKRMEELEWTIEKAHLKDLVEVQEDFESLRKEGLQVLVYGKTFYWRLVSLFGAHLNASTDLPLPNYESAISTNGKRFIRGIKIVLGALAKEFPLVSIGTKIFDEIYKQVKKTQYENNTAAIYRIIMAKCDSDQVIHINLAKAAIAIANFKKNTIQDLQSSTDSVLELLSEIPNGIKEMILPSLELHDSDSQGAILALRDVSLLMVYLYKHYARLTASVGTLAEIIEAIVTSGELEEPQSRKH